MKKILFLVFLGGLFFFVATRSMADCPPNWDSRAIIVPVNGCLYLIEYCYKCGVTGPDPGNVRITYYGRLPREQQPNPDNCSDYEVDFNIIRQAVAERYLNRLYHSRLFYRGGCKIYFRIPFM